MLAVAGPRGWRDSAMDSFTTLEDNAMPTKKRGALRPKAIKRADLARAIAKGREVREAWNRAFPNGDHWQAEQIEAMLMPTLWERMLHNMELHHHAAWAWREPPYRLFANGLTGYVLPQWNSAPTERWQHSHCPSVCWDGIRRNCFGSLGELLRGEHYQPDSHYVDELWLRWRIRLA